MNRIRPSEHFAKIGHPPAVLRIIGDHIEGLDQIIALTDNRGDSMMAIERDVL